MKKLELGNQVFKADEEFIPLLKELYRSGLNPTQHCCGHGGEAYLSIEITPDMEIGIRHDVRPRLIIRWSARSEQRKAQEPCNHQWVSAVNEVVKSGEICTKCFALRASVKEGWDGSRKN